MGLNFELVRLTQEEISVILKGLDKLDPKDDYDAYRIGGHLTYFLKNLR